MSENENAATDPAPDPSVQESRLSSLAAPASGPTRASAQVAETLLLALASGQTVTQIEAIVLQGSQERSQEMAHGHYEAVPTIPVSTDPEPLEKQPLEEMTLLNTSASEQTQEQEDLQPPPISSTSESLVQAMDQESVHQEGVAHSDTESPPPPAEDSPPSWEQMEALLWQQVVEPATKPAVQNAISTRPLPEAPLLAPPPPPTLPLPEATAPAPPLYQTNGGNAAIPGPWRLPSQHVARWKMSQKIALLLLVGLVGIASLIGGLVLLMPGPNHGTVAGAQRSGTGSTAGAQYSTSFAPSTPSAGTPTVLLPTTAAGNAIPTATSQQGIDATPQLSATLTPTSTPQATPTVASVSTSTLIPTATPIPTAKATPIPTATLVPTAKATPVPTAKATPTATPVPSTTCAGNGVYVYQDINYGGICEKFTSNIPELRGTIVGSDTATSIKIVGSYTVTLYADSNYQGASSVVTSNVPDLTKLAVGNDTLSSMKIQ